MAKQLVCDSCGATAPDTEEGHRAWIGVALHKVLVPTSVVKAYDLCKPCGERVRRALIEPRVKPYSETIEFTDPVLKPGV